MPGLIVLLTVLFFALKMGGVIAWSWFWVLSPIWGALILALICGVIALLAVVAGAAVVLSR
jgi:hypothetical protein